jgi:copper chaperone CopZ
MRCLSYSLVVLSLSCLLFGCSHAPAPNAAPTAEAIETTPPPPEGVTLVKLKLPGMVCGGCAMEVKDTLTKVDGVSHLATDPNKHECTFWYAKADSEIKAKLDELAKTNDKISGYEWVN